MENNENNLARWVDERLDTLQSAANFQPKTPQALARVQQRDRVYQVKCRRWFWGCAAAAAVCLAALAVPAHCRAASTSSCREPVATRLWDSVFHKPGEPAPAPITSPLAMAPPAVAAPAPAPAAKPAAKPAPVPAPAPPRPAASPFKESGSSTAPITCVLYSDYACPHCAQVFLDMLPLLMADYVQTGKVHLLHRDFPLPMHPYARLAARYANAAGRSGVYDLVATQLYRTQAQWVQGGDIQSQLSQVLLPAVLNQVQTLVNDPNFDDGIDAEVAMARQEQLQGTPSMVIVRGVTQKVLLGIPSYSLLKGYLDELLAGK